MAVKKGKNQKPIDHNEEKISETGSKTPNISDTFLNELKGAFTKFDTISQSKRIELYGDQKYLDQFREYFKKEYPNLLDKIDQKDLPVYIHALENKGFSLKRILDEDDNKKLHAEFKSEDTEEHVIQKSLGDLKEFCEDSLNNVPADAFNRFATLAGFNPNNLQLYPDGKLTTVDEMLILRKKFLEKEGITLGQTALAHSERILTPKYNPIERMMVSIAISKIRRELKGPLKTAFDTEFPAKVTIFSSYQNLVDFKTEWQQFLIDHATEIDQSLAKKLDAIIITNGDIQKEIAKTGRKFDDTKGFSEWESYFRGIFNKLVTRQLFEEVQQKQETIDHYIGTMGNTFKEFPPYVNEIMKIQEYTFNAKTIAGVDPGFETDLQAIDSQILTLQEQYAVANETERKIIRKKILDLKQQSEKRRWQAYITFLRSKNPSLADVFATLVSHTFDFSTLSSDQQQLLIDTLMKHKLQDTIKNKVPELLSVSEEDLTAFVNDLFDLKKMDLTIPTRYGHVPLNFLKKEFMSTVNTQLPGINDLEKLKNLPLNFLIQITEGNASFFEDGVIFDSLFTNFAAKNGTFRLNEAYKVRIKKDGKVAEGYLSPYSILDERNIEHRDGHELYLYSKPVTSPSQERSLVYWKQENDGADQGIPVVIKDMEEQDCNVEVLNKQINLNGEALGALLFGYVLGQESLHADLPPEKEKALGEKLGKLSTYKEKVEDEEEQEQETTKAPSEAVTETSDQEKKFMKEREQLAGYNFPSDKYKDNGFVKGTTLFIPFEESVMPPSQSGGSAWMEMKIVDINKEKGTFTMKMFGGETRLGKYEGVEKTVPISADSLADIRKYFGSRIYKFPDPSKHSIEDWMSMLNSNKAGEGLHNSFGRLKFQSGKFKFLMGDEVGETVESFGLYEPEIGEGADEELGTWALYKVTHNSNNTFTLKGDFLDKDGKKTTHTREMDYPTFLLFINEKKLQPKSKKQAELMKKREDLKSKEVETTRTGFSINNVFGFFKNGFSKLKDSIKKYDDERTEELTDLLTDQGKLYDSIGKLFSPFGRISGAFESMGVEYFSDRDSRLRKKVEKWKKFYEDADFSMLYNNHIGPMIQGKITIKPHYKAAAMLLAMIAKGKGPYNRNPEFAAKGMWINILMGKEHQARYLAMREKLIREMEQGSAQYGGIWTDNKKNEILELEMKYMVHVMDGRQLGIQDGDKTKYFFYNKYSKQFIDELEKGYNGFFSQSTVEEGFGKVKGASFDFARAEFFRLLPDRPQQAIPFLKVMATKATSPAQWRTFEMAVLTGMLSGVFLTMTMSETQGMIKNICRTRGFVPGIRVKDINQQVKLQRMLDIFSGGKFTSGVKYTPNKFSFSDMSGGTRDIVKSVPKRMLAGDTLTNLSEFFKIKGKNIEGRTLLEIYADPKTSMNDKMLIQEFLDNSNEKNESLDNDVRNNPYAMSGSILTKSQSAVHQMMKFDQNGFAGKDGDEIQTMKGFFVDMKGAIPTKKLSSFEEVQFFLEKFFNRFDEKGFSLNNKTTLIKRLKRCQQHPGRKEVDDVLYYSIVGQICDSLGRVQIPDEFHDALLSWKDFFKHNLSTILEPDIIASTFGGASYKQDFYRYSPELEPWENCVNILDRDLKQAYLITLPPDQRKLVNQNLTKLKSNQNYLNVPLYDMADKLFRNCGMENRFRNSVSETANSIASFQKPSPSKVTGAKINNPEVADKVRRILEGKSPIDLPKNEYIPEDEYDDYYDMTV